MTAFAFTNPGAPTTTLTVSTTPTTLSIPGGPGMGHQVFLHNTSSAPVSIVFFNTGSTAPTSIDPTMGFQMPAGAFLGPFALGAVPQSIAVTTASGTGTLRVTPGYEA